MEPMSTGIIVRAGMGMKNEENETQEGQIQPSRSVLNQIFIDPKILHFFLFLAVPEITNQNRRKCFMIDR